MSTGELQDSDQPHLGRLATAHKRQPAGGRQLLASTGFQWAVPLAQHTEMLSAFASPGALR
jgi:hypothetical protein